VGRRLATVSASVLKRRNVRPEKIDIDREEDIDKKKVITSQINFWRNSMRRFKVKEPRFKEIFGKQHKLLVEPKK
jgi:hypothetical protein